MVSLVESNPIVSTFSIITDAELENQKLK